MIKQLSCTFAGVTLLATALSGCGSDSSPDLVVSTTATTTVTSGNGGTTTTTATPVAVTRVAIGPSAALTLAQGAQQQLTLTVTRSDGSTVDLTEQATWSSSKPAQVAVSNTPGSRGRVTATTTGGGAATIVASVNGFSATSVVTVSGARLGRLLDNTSTTTVPVGYTLGLAVVGSYDDGSSASLTNSATYVSANPAVATVDDTGRVTVVAAGDTTITATVANQTRTFPIHGVASTLTSVVISPQDATVRLAPGQTTDLTVTGAFSGNEALDLTSQTSFTVDNANVASIDAGGHLTAVADGTATVTASVAPPGGGAAVTSTRQFQVLTASANLTEHRVPFTYQDISLSGERVIAGDDEDGPVNGPADFLFSLLTTPDAPSGWNATTNGQLTLASGSVNPFDDDDDQIVFKSVLGTAPNRQLILQWVGGHYDADNNRDGQAVFFESTNQFEVRYLRLDADFGASTRAQITASGTTLTHSNLTPTLLNSTAFRYIP